jgi:biopolymer transport protein TolR
MPKERFRRRPMSEINVVPYIDVMLVLLVIFMITTPLLTQGVKVNLPRTPAEILESEQQDVLVVIVDAAGNFYITFGDDQDKPIDAETLVNRVNALLRHRPGIPVLVRGDKDAAYGDVVVAMALLQRAGAPSVGLMTESPDPVER